MTLKITKRMLELNYHTSTEDLTYKDGIYHLLYKPKNQCYYGKNNYYYQIQNNQIKFTYRERFDDEDIVTIFDFDITDIINNKYQHMEYLSILFSVIADATYDVNHDPIYKRSIETIIIDNLTTQDDNEYIPKRFKYHDYLTDNDIYSEDIQFLYGQEHLVPHTILVPIYNYLICNADDDKLADYHKESIKILKQRIIDEKPKIYIGSIPIDIDCELITYQSTFKWTEPDTEQEK